MAAATGGTVQTSVNNVIDEVMSFFRSAHAHYMLNDLIFIVCQLDIEG